MINNNSTKTSTSKFQFDLESMGSRRANYVEDATVNSHLLSLFIIIIIIIIIIVIITCLRSKAVIIKLVWHIVNSEYKLSILPVVIPDTVA